jgi:tetratricopeptide (TPR) repeat protein
MGADKIKGLWEKILRDTRLVFFSLILLAGCATASLEHVRLDPDQTANRLMDYVNKQKEYGKAIELGQAITAQSPSYAPGWYWLGAAYYWKDQYDQAIVAFQKVAEIKPQTAQLPSSYEHLGFINIFKKNYSEALRWFNLALDQDPNRVDAVYGRALIYLSQGRYDEALAEAERLIAQLKPVENREQVVQAMQVKAFSLLGLGEVEMALSLIQKIKEVSPRYNSWDDLALIYYASGDEKNLNEHFSKRGWLGIEDRNYRDESIQAVEIISIIKDSPAEKGGLLKGDLILRMDGKVMQDVQELLDKIMGTPPGTRVQFEIRRGKEKREIALPLGSFPREGQNYENHIFISALLGKKKIYRQAEQAEKNGEIRKALQLYLEASMKHGPDSDLLKRVMKLYKGLDPPPAIPEEARKCAVFGMTAAKESKDSQGFDRAIEEYRKAIGLAPWWVDLYYNLALVQEQRGDFRQAAGSLKLYLLASPNDPQTQLIQNKIYELEYKLEKR